jgi:glycosyltransferase involved in cell wall biosynthesis
MRILYINHTSVISGAEQSLLVLLRAMRGIADAQLACPEGELAAAARTSGVPVHVIRGTDVSARLDPLHTPRELVRAVAGALELRALARRVRATVIHANTPRAAMIAAAAAGPRGTPLVLHVRDSPPPGRLPAVLFTGLAARTSAWIVTSRFLAEQLPAAATPSAARPLIRVVPNAVEPERFDAAAIPIAQARARLGIGPGEPTLAIVGQISPHKAQSDALQILARIRAAGLPARLLIVGSVKFTSAATRFDNQRYELDCRQLAERLGLDDAVVWLGERPDIGPLLRAADLLLVPSWYEPFGRVALEAMMMEVPVLATSIGGVREVVRHGQDGLILDPRDAERWAEAATALLGDGDRRRQMGLSGRRHALQCFGAAAHAREIAAVYRQLTGTNLHAGSIPSDSLTAGRQRPTSSGSGAARG